MLKIEFRDVKISYEIAKHTRRCGKLDFLWGVMWRNGRLDLSGPTCKVGVFRHGALELGARPPGG